MSRKSTERGLILTEALVALVVLAIVLSAVLLIAEQNAGRSASVERRTIMLVRARNLVESVGLNVPAVDGTQLGDFGDGMTWQANLSHISRPSRSDLPPGASLVDCTIHIRDKLEPAHTTDLHEIAIIPAS